MVVNEMTNDTVQPKKTSGCDDDCDEGLLFDFGVVEGLLPLLSEYWSQQCLAWQARNSN
jgi:hypothetical protein